MTDSLRDRIAAAIYNENPYAWTPDQCDTAADAVIVGLADYRIVKRSEYDVVRRIARRHTQASGELTDSESAK